MVWRPITDRATAAADTTSATPIESTMSVRLRSVRAPVAKILLIFLILGSFAPVMASLVGHSQVLSHLVDWRVAELVRALTAPRG